MTLLILSFLVAIIDWIAVARRNRRLEYWAKPATLVLLLFAFLWLAPRPLSALSFAFALGLGLSLVGDVLLMLPSDRFVAGLVSFLLAHLGYITAFNLEGPIVNAPGLLLALPLGIVAWRVLRRLTSAMRQAGRERLIAPVAMYGAVLSLMAWSAASTMLRPAWQGSAGWLAAVGGVLFFTSDTMLAWMRFVRPLPGGRVAEMITYHAAQYALSAAVLLRLGAF
ncbi:MAG: lysoplasmalogenase [Chloroflexota bacterium]